MHGTSELLAFLLHRLGTLGLLTLIALALSIAVAAALTVVAAGELLAVGTDPVQVAPLRWLRRV